MRRKAKTANFGIIYGISIFGLAERMNVDRKEAKELIDGYFETYPQVREYMDKSIQIAREQGYVETIFHRKRFLPDINSRNATVRGYAERNAINALSREVQLISLKLPWHASTNAFKVTI